MTPVDHRELVRRRRDSGPLEAQARRELARRVSGGIEVALYWSADDGRTSVELRDRSSARTLLFEVARERALDAFHHPFAHLPVPPEESLPSFEP